MSPKKLELEIHDIGNILFDSSGEGLVVIDKSGKIRKINPRLTEMFGYSREKLIGEAIEILIPENLRSKHNTHRDKYNENPKKRSMGKGMDLLGQRENGTTFAVEISLNHFEANGESLVMGLVSDVTERKRKDQALIELNSELEKRVLERTRALEESQLLYQMIARNFPNGAIHVYDKELNFVFADGKEMLGHKKSENLVGINYIDLLPKKNREKVRENLTSVFDGSSISFEISYNEKTWIVNAVGLQNANGEINQILAVQQNITLLKGAEIDIFESLKKEKHLNELKSRFVAMASHEFRTPLTSILSSVSLIGKYIGLENNDEKQWKHVDRIKISVYHLINILNDFLSLEKFEDGKMEHVLTSTNLTEFMTSIVEDIQSIAKPNQEIIHTHTGSTRGKLSQEVFKHVFNNLLSNAVKYSPENVKIEFTTSLKNDVFTAVIVDQGIGIPFDEQKHLFERFFRAKNALNKEGTGLGLYIVKKYIDMANGTISFKSDIDKGTIFTVEIPVEKIIES